MQIRKLSGIVFTSFSILVKKDSLETNGLSNNRSKSSPFLAAILRYTSLPVVTAKDLDDKLCEPNKESTWFGRSNTINKNRMENRVVLVTGGAGFVGQHVVKHLQEKVDGVKEIRVFDVKPYNNTIGHDDFKPVKSIVGDLRKPEDIENALAGVDAVIHTAGVVSFGVFPNHTAMEQVNVNGTKNLIEGCVKQNVPRLVFTSTIDVVIGYDEIVDGDEFLTAPTKFLFPGYPDTKYRAEKLVLLANGRKLAAGDGSVLTTLALRPNVMYGEGDPHYIPNALKGAEKNCGVLPKIGNGKALFQHAYVGNMAWAHIKALEALKNDPANCGGQTYFITDDSPVKNSFELMEPFLKARGFSLSDYSIPYPLVYSLLFVTENILWALSPLYKIDFNTALCSIIYINKTFYFNRKKAEEKLGYKPLYNYNECLEKSLRYYMEMDLSA